MHSSIQKTAAPSWEEIKNTIAGGWSKAVSKTPEGMQSFLQNHGKDVTRGLAGATIAGGLYGVTATRRSYESEEEFRRRRFRGALQTAVLGGALGGLSGPVSEFIKKKAPDIREDLNRQAIYSDVNTNPEYAHGNLRKQVGESIGMKPEEIAPGDPNAPKPTWMRAGEGAETGSTVAGAAIGAYGVQRALKGTAEMYFPKRTDPVINRIGDLKHIVDIENANRTPVPGLGKVPISAAGQVAQAEIAAANKGSLGRTMGRGAVRGGGGIVGGLIGGFLGNQAGEAARDWIAPGWYDPNFIDRSAEGLAAPGGNSLAAPSTPSASGGSPKWSPLHPG